MDTNEIRAAANSAVMRIGQDREEFIRNSYPDEDFERIVKMCNFLDDVANNAYEEYRLNPCEYNRGIHHEL